MQPIGFDSFFLPPVDGYMPPTLESMVSTRVPQLGLYIRPLVGGVGGGFKNLGHFPGQLSQSLQGWHVDLSIF